LGMHQIKQASFNLLCLFCITLMDTIPTSLMSAMNAREVLLRMLASVAVWCMQTCWVVDISIIIEILQDTNFFSNTAGEMRNLSKGYEE
jgi:hypothetical protein